MGILVGTGTAKAPSKILTGVGGTAKNVSAVYVGGSDGQAKKVYPSYETITPKWVCVGQNGTVGYSQNGIKWYWTTITTANLFSVEYTTFIDRAVFVAVGGSSNSPEIWYSSNGALWTKDSSATTSNVGAAPLRVVTRPFLYGSIPLPVIAVSSSINNASIGTATTGIGPQNPVVWTPRYASASSSNVAAINDGVVRNPGTTSPLLLTGSNYVVSFTTSGTTRVAAVASTYTLSRIRYLPSIGWCVGGYTATSGPNAVGGCIAYTYASDGLSSWTTSLSGSGVMGITALATNGTEMYAGGWQTNADTAVVASSNLISWYGSFIPRIPVGRNISSMAFGTIEDYTFGGTVDDQILCVTQNYNSVVPDAGYIFDRYNDRVNAIAPGSASLFSITYGNNQNSVIVAA